MTPLPRGGSLSLPSSVTTGISPKHPCNSTIHSTLFSPPPLSPPLWPPSRGAPSINDPSRLPATTSSSHLPRARILPVQFWQSKYRSPRETEGRLARRGACRSASYANRCITPLGAREAQLAALDRFGVYSGGLCAEAEAEVEPQRNGQMREAAGRGNMKGCGNSIQPQVKRSSLELIKSLHACPSCPRLCLSV